MSFDLLKETAAKLHGFDSSVDRDELLMTAESSMAVFLMEARQALARSTHKRLEAAQAKQSIDSIGLVLQNLKYEKSHLKNEIEACENFETIFQDIPLEPLEQFMLRDVEGSMDSHKQEEDKEHSLMLCRLRFELAERKRLLLILEGLKTEKDRIYRECKARNDDLRDIDAQIEALVQSSVPLQNKLDIHIAEDRISLEKSELLPPPLFNLYKNALGFILTYGREGLIIEIGGEPGESSSNKLYDAHPLSLMLTIQDPKPLAKLIFVYLPALGIVVVKTDLIDPFDYLPASFLASGLFPLDDGIETPNPANAFLNGGNFAFDQQAAGGFAFHWAQLISGLRFPMPTSLNTTHNGLWISVPSNAQDATEEDGATADETETRLPTLKHVVDRIFARRKLLLEVNQTIAAMRMGKLTVPILKSGVSTVQKLVSFKPISKEPDRQTFEMVIQIESNASNGDSQKNSSAKAKYTVEITMFASYPETGCKLRIVKEDRKPDDECDLEDSRFRDIEEKLSILSPDDMINEFVEYRPKNLMAYYIVKLVELLLKAN